MWTLNRLGGTVEPITGFPVGLTRPANHATHPLDFGAKIAAIVAGHFHQRGMALRCLGEGVLDLDVLQIREAVYRAQCPSDPAPAISLTSIIVVIG